MYLIYVFVPRRWKEKVKHAMFAAGAGRQGEYSQACWETAGRGQFLPGEGASPAIGRRFSLRRVREFRVEMICAEKYGADVVKALRMAHPYEEPAFGLIRLEDPHEDPHEELPHERTPNERRSP